VGTSCDKKRIQQIWTSLIFHVNCTLTILNMTQSSNPAEWKIAGDTSSQDQNEFAKFLDDFNQPWLGKILDDVESNKASGTESEPFAYASKTHGDEDLSPLTLAADSDNGLPRDHSQSGQNQAPSQNFNWRGSDAKSSFGSEYNFTVELVDNSTNIFEADMVSNWQYSDFEDDAAGGRTYNPQHAVEKFGANPLFNPGFGDPSMGLHSAATGDNAISLENRIDATSAIEPELWLSTLDASLPLDSRPRRSMRRSNIPTNRPHAQHKSHPCDRCPNVFGRAGDLRRHYRVHFPDRRTFHCHFEGCNRNGQRGFYRRDKFRDHQRQAHGFGSGSELVLLESV
jgi:hypothetical protein